MTVVRAKTKSINYERHYEVIHHGQTFYVPSINTLKSATVPAPALENWKINRHLDAAHASSELASQMAAKPFRQMIRAEVRDDKAAADSGSRAHEVAEAMLLGEPLPDHPERPWMQEHVESFIEEFDVSPVNWPGFPGVEVAVATVVRDRPLWVGTSDLIARHNQHMQPTVIDWKTGASGVWQDALLTTTGYVTATHLVEPTGQLTPLPESIKDGWVVWVRPEGFAVHPITPDDVAANYRALIAMSIMWDWRDEATVRAPINESPLRKKRY